MSRLILEQQGQNEGFVVRNLTPLSLLVSHLKIDIMNQEIGKSPRDGLCCLDGTASQSHEFC